MYIPHEGLMHVVRVIGYPGLALTIFAESGLFFGFFLPGSSMLFSAGLLAASGVFNVWILIPIMAIAAVLGDSAGYWFGTYVGMSFFFKRDSRFFKHEYLERAKVFYEAHGVQAVMLARFVPIVRTFAPIVAGIARMRYRSFVFYNILGALLWAAGITWAGYYLGKRVPFVADYITPIALVIIMLSLVPIFWEVRKPKQNQ